MNQSMIQCGVEYFFLVFGTAFYTDAPEVCIPFVTGGGANVVKRQRHLFFVKVISCVGN